MEGDRTKTRQFVLLPESFLRAGMPFVPQQMREDLLAVGEASAEQIETLAGALEHEPGVLTDGRLEEIIGRHIGMPPLADAILRALVNLSPESVEEAVRNLRQWREASPPNGAKLPVERLEQVRDRLSRLIRNYPALVRYRKAESLKTLTGRVAESTELVSDLRPVFDQSRTTVEGLIPLTTLRVTYRSGDATDVLEVLLSMEALEDLASEVEKAKKKLAALRESVGRWVPHGWVGPE